VNQPRIDRPVRIIPGMVVRLTRDVQEVMTGEPKPHHIKAYKKGEIGVVIGVHHCHAMGLVAMVLWRSDLESLARRMGTAGGDGSLDYNDDYSVRMVDVGIEADNSGVMAIRLDDFEPVLDKDV